MNDDILDDATQRVIGQMIRASRTLPEDFFLVPAMQELAGFVGRSTLSDEDRSLLIGVGAVIIRESRAELSAQIQAAMAIANAKGEMR
jgi:hypothetical protein